MRESDSNCERVRGRAEEIPFSQHEVLNIFYNCVFVVCQKCIFYGCHQRSLADKDVRIFTLNLNEKTQNCQMEVAYHIAKEGNFCMRYLAILIFRNY